MFDAKDIETRLTRRFGLGSKPVLRQALYQRLGLLCEQKGESAYVLIRVVADEALGKRKPAQYFAWVVIRRLMERGIIDVPEL